MSIKRITIIGLGLIGGSLGLALKKARGAQIEVTGCARRDEVAEKAIEHGAVDRTESRPGKAVAEAELVIVATPVMAIKDAFEQISAHLSPGAIVSDVGSTKAQIMKWAQESLPQTINFIGGHPMTGKETAGIDEAEAGLFEGCIYCLTPSRHASPQALKSMEEMIGWIGARPLLIEAEPHDELVAGISHLPLVLSSTLVATLAENNQWPDMSKLAASGYGDTTRLASGDPELYCGICLTNRQAIVEWVDRYIQRLKECRQLITENEEGLKEFFQQARESRENWLKNEGSQFKK
ncbi:MAG: prephenate dehydrogenase [Dehalococcoidia bacterium]